MGDVKVRVGADISGLRTGLQNAKREVDSFGSSAGSSLERFGARMLAVFSIGAVSNWVRGIFAAVGALQDAADRADLSLESFQKLSRFFQDSGVKSETFGKAMARLNQVVGDAKNGNETARASLEKYGLTWEKIHRLSIEEMFFVISDSIAKATDKTVAAADAADLFGAKISEKIVPGMAQGSEAIKKFGDDVKVMTDEAGNDIATLGDRFEQFWQSVNMGAGKAIHAVVSNPLKLIKDNFRVVTGQATKSEIENPKRTAPVAPLPPSKPTPEDPRIIEEKKKQAEEMAKFDKLISDTSNKEAKERLETERECLLAEIELARKAGEDRKKIEEDQIEHNRQQYHDWLVDKDRMDREAAAKAAADQRQRQVDKASEMITEREAEIDEEMKPASQKRAEKRESDARDKAGRKIQRKKDEAEKVAKQNDVNRPDIFKKEDPREHWKKGGDRAKDSAGKKEKGPEQSPAEAMRSDIAEIKGHISTLVSKINVK